MGVPHSPLLFGTVFGKVAVWKACEYGECDKLGSEKECGRPECCASSGSVLRRLDVSTVLTSGGSDCIGDLPFPVSDVSEEWNGLG